MILEDLRRRHVCLHGGTKAVAFVNGGHLQKFQKEKRNANTASRSKTFGGISQIKPILPLSFVVSGDYLLTSSSSAEPRWSASYVQRGTLEVCAGGMAVEPGGDFSAPFPPSPQVLISIYELPHVPSPATASGGKISLRP